MCNTEGYLNLHEMIGKVHNLIKELTHDNKTLNKKLELIHEHNIRLESRLSSKLNEPEVQNQAKSVHPDCIKPKTTNLITSDIIIDDEKLPSTTIINLTSESVVKTGKKQTSNYRLSSRCQKIRLTQISR